MKIEVELDKKHLVASLLTVAEACSQSDDPQANMMNGFIEQTARELWKDLPRDYKHAVELEASE